MLLTRQQLAMSLVQLVQDDYKLLNDILVDYVDGLNDTDFDNFEAYVNSNINEIMH